LANVIPPGLRRCLGAVRSVGPATVAVTLALVIGAAGFADAATGGSFILGKSNSENAIATLANGKGTPLSLQAPAGKAPLAVNRSIQVHNLNAQYVDGKTAAQLQSNGGAGMTVTNEGIPLSPDQIKIVSTGKLPAGTYAVSATAFMAAEGDQAICYITDAANGANPNNALSYGGGESTIVQAAETAVVTVPAKGTVSEWCYGSTGQTVLNAGITAIRLDSVSWGTEPIKFARPAAKAQRP
jgi:hypothetical protein